jgi:hypothetical protein
VDTAYKFYLVWIYTRGWSIWGYCIWRLGGVADYGSLTSNQDDLQLPIECLHHLFAPTANRNITGLANGKAGLRFYLVNQSDTYSITLKHDVTSTLGMRFLLPGGVDYEIQPQAPYLRQISPLRDTNASLRLR